MHVSAALRAALILGCVTCSIAARADDKSDCIAASEKAQSLRDDRKLLDARAQFLVCARDACPAAIRKDCADQVGAVQQRTPSVVLHAKDRAGQDLVAVKVTADGKPVTEQLDGRSIPLDPGVHTFRFEAAGSEPVEQKIVLAEGEHDRAVSARFGGGETAASAGLGARTEKRGAPVGAFVLGGVGLVAMGVGAAFWGIGLGEKSSDETTCKPSCTAAQVDSIREKLVIGDVVFFSGAAVLATGLVWTLVHYATGQKESAAPATARFDVAPTTYGRGAVASTTIRW